MSVFVTTGRFSGQVIATFKTNRGEESYEEIGWDSSQISGSMMARKTSLNCLVSRNPVIGGFCGIRLAIQLNSDLL